MRRYIQFFENLLFPPRCISCGSFLQKNLLDPCERPFCPTCHMAWEREKGDICLDCGLPLTLCRCCPGGVKRAGLCEVIKLVGYDTQRETPGRRAILAMKKRMSRRALRYFAGQLLLPVRRYMDEQGLTPGDVAFCHVPRGRANVSRYGFDQAEQLCRSLARQCGARYFPLLRRVGGKKEQKRLSAEERKQNVSRGFLVEASLLSGEKDIQCLFLVDDILTTGASLCGCASVLRPAYTGKLVAVVIAQTPKKRREA